MEWGGFRLSKSGIKMDINIGLISFHVGQWIFIFEMCWKH
ncbi:unnamed protein product [Brugia timori]|uniref:Uncharacterized protein n=1 Tax=Brugia timori TaxID=42155 RepID=A0A3P7W8K6_9BILA|nr:unnamed protein product [Brugia timori]